MEFLIIAFVVLIISIVIKIVFNINLKKIKKDVENKKLDEVTKKYPENIAICKYNFLISAIYYSFFPHHIAIYYINN